MKLKLPKKIITSLVLIALIFGVLPAPSPSYAAAGGTCGDDLYWSYSDNVLTISGTGDMYDFTMKTSNNLPTEMPWRSYQTTISRVIIEDGVCGIGDYSFYNFPMLSEIVFPETSLKRIGRSAFSRCEKIKKIVLPDSVESLGASVFSACSSLTYISFGASLATVPQGACFEDSALSTVILGEGCRTLGNQAFGKCSSLKSIDVKQIETFESLCLSYTSLTSVVIGSGVKNLRSNAFAYSQSLKTITFEPGAEPEQVSSRALANTPYYSALPNGVYTMFDGQVLMNKGTYTASELVIPDGVRIVSDLAFDSTSALSSVRIPESVTTIGDYAFRDCRNLKSVFIPPTVTKLGAGCFGKYSVNMGYESYTFFKITGHGFGVASEYAAAELLYYSCAHSYESVTASDDCTKGVTKANVCKYCGTCNYKKTVVSSHRFTVVETEPTCEVDGVTKRVCSVCGIEEIVGTKSATGHVQGGEWIVETLPDCSRSGRVVRMCTVCGGVAEEIVLSRETEHKKAKKYTVSVPAGCTTPGVETLLCTVCGEALDERIIPATGHTPSDEWHAISLPTPDGSLRGCSIRCCTKCSEILEVVWPDADGTAGASGAASDNIRAISSMIGGKTNVAPLESTDYFADGIFSAKDLLALRLLAAKG